MEKQAYKDSIRIRVFITINDPIKGINLKVTTNESSKTKNINLQFYRKKWLTVSEHTNFSKLMQLIEKSACHHREGNAL